MVMSYLIRKGQSKVKKKRVTSALTSHFRYVALPASYEKYRNLILNATT